MNKMAADTNETWSTNDTTLMITNTSETTIKIKDFVTTTDVSTITTAADNDTDALYVGQFQTGSCVSTSVGYGILGFLVALLTLALICVCVLFYLSRKRKHVHFFPRAFNKWIAGGPGHHHHHHHNNHHNHGYTDDPDAYHDPDYALAGPMGDIDPEALGSPGPSPGPSPGSSPGPSPGPTRRSSDPEQPELEGKVKMSAQTLWKSATLPSHSKSSKTLLPEERIQHWCKTLDGICAEMKQVMVTGQTASSMTVENENNTKDTSLKHKLKSFVTHKVTPTRSQSLPRTQPRLADQHPVKYHRSQSEERSHHQTGNDPSNHNHSKPISQFSNSPTQHEWKTSASDDDMTDIDELDEMDPVRIEIDLLMKQAERQLSSREVVEETDSVIQDTHDENTNISMNKRDVKMHDENIYDNDYSPEQFDPNPRTSSISDDQFYLDMTTIQHLCPELKSPGQDTTPKETSVNLDNLKDIQPDSPSKLHFVMESTKRSENQQQSCSGEKASEASVAKKTKTVKALSSEEPFEDQHIYSNDKEQIFTNTLSAEQEPSKYSSPPNEEDMSIYDIPVVKPAEERRTRNNQKGSVSQHKEEEEERPADQEKKNKESNEIYVKGVAVPIESNDCKPRKEHLPGESKEDNKTFTFEELDEKDFPSKEKMPTTIEIDNIKPSEATLNDTSSKLRDKDVSIARPSKKRDSDPDYERISFKPYPSTMPATSSADHTLQSKPMQSSNLNVPEESRLSQISQGSNISELYYEDINADDQSDDESDDQDPSELMISRSIKQAPTAPQTTAENSQEEYADMADYTATPPRPPSVTLIPRRPSKTDDVPTKYSFPLPKPLPKTRAQTPPPAQDDDIYDEVAATREPPSLPERNPKENKGTSRPLKLPPPRRNPSPPPTDEDDDGPFEEYDDVAMNPPKRPSADSIPHKHHPQQSAENDAPVRSPTSAPVTVSNADEAKDGPFEEYDDIDKSPPKPPLSDSIPGKHYQQHLYPASLPTSTPVTVANEDEDEDGPFEEYDDVAMNPTKAPSVDSMPGKHYQQRLDPVRSPTSAPVTVANADEEEDIYIYEPFEENDDVPLNPSKKTLAASIPHKHHPQKSPNLSEEYDQPQEEYDEVVVSESNPSKHATMGSRTSEQDDNNNNNKDNKTDKKKEIEEDFMDDDNDDDNVYDCVQFPGALGPTTESEA